MTDKVKFMIENFMDYHNEGYSIKEIAKICGITDRTIYYYLELIAKNNDVSRNSLLRNTHKQHKKLVTPHIHKLHKKKNVEIECSVNSQMNQNDNSDLLKKDNHQILMQNKPNVQQEQNNIVGYEELMEEYQKLELKVIKLLEFIDSITDKNRRI